MCGVQCGRVNRLEIAAQLVRGTRTGGKHLDHNDDDDDDDGDDDDGDDDDGDDDDDDDDIGDDDCDNEVDDDDDVGDFYDACVRPSLLQRLALEERH